MNLNISKGLWRPCLNESGLFYGAKAQTFYLWGFLMFWQCICIDNFVSSVILECIAVRSCWNFLMTFQHFYRFIKMFKLLLKWASRGWFHCQVFSSEKFTSDGCILHSLSLFIPHVFRARTQKSVRWLGWLNTSKCLLDLGETDVYLPLRADVWTEKCEDDIGGRKMHAHSDRQTTWPPFGFSLLEWTLVSHF